MRRTPNSRSAGPRRPVAGPSPCTAGALPARERSRAKEHLMATYKVGYMIGSLAKASINRKLANAMVRLAPAGLEMSEIPFKDLPLYSYDYDADYPRVARD